MMLRLLGPFIPLLLFVPQLARCGGGGAESYEPVSHRHFTYPIRENRSVYIPLVDYLMEDYDKHALPVCVVGGVTEAQLDMWLYQLFDLDEPTQALTIDVWIELTWHDCRLEWDPAKYNGINQLTIKAGYLWHPDLIFYQSLHGNFEEALFVFKESTARVRHTGVIQLGAQVVLRSFCRIKIEHYPFDRQQCNITLVSWNKDSTMFRMTKRVDDEEDSRGHSFGKASNGEWEVLGFPSQNNIGRYLVGADEDTVNNYTEVIFTLKLARKPTYVMMYLVFPCLLLIWLSSFTFVLPVECGEKIGLCVTVLLSLIVFLLLVAENVPHTSDGIPVLGNLFCSSVLLSCICVFMTSLVLNVGLKTQEIAMPKWLQKFMRHWSTLICCFHFHDHATVHQWVSWHKKCDYGNGGGRMDAAENRKSTDTDDVVERLTDDQLDGIIVCEKNHWRYLAMLLDRIFMVVYILLATVLTAYIFACYYRLSRQ